MIEIKNKELCSGCGACKEGCPKDCISLLPDEEGFLYPKILLNKCIHCNICNKTCPILSPLRRVSTFRKGFIVQSKDDGFLNACSSGGFTPHLFNYVIAQGGVVYGAAVIKENRIDHVRVSSLPDIPKLLGSKYVQSNSFNVFPMVKQDLEKGMLVCFCGTPCQVAGLKKYLSEDFANLFCLEVVCHGVASPLLWENYLERMEKKYKSKPVSLNFRYKTYGYHSGTMKVTFENGKSYYASARTDLFLRSFFKEVSSRPSCYHCSFKGYERNSDFTLLDCWSYAKITGDVDNDRGHTNVLVNSEKGYQIFEKIKSDFISREINSALLIKFDGSMFVDSAKPNLERDNFYRTLVEKGLERAVKRYIPRKPHDFIIEFLKRFYYSKQRIK